MKRAVIAMMAGLWALGAPDGHAAVRVLLTRGGVESVYGTYASGAVISDLPAMDETYSLVRVLGDPGDTIGMISLKGALPEGAVLDVQVAGVVVERVSGVVLNAAGGPAWRGLMVSSGLRERVRLTASVGVVSGAVEAGEVVRLEAEVIDAPVTAWGVGGAKVARVEVKRKVTEAGLIRSVAGGIGTVRVGEGVEGDGLFGGVVSEGGRIGEVLVAGRVEVARDTGILARDGIGTIRCTDAEAVWGPVDAKIDSNTGGHQGFEDPRLGTLYTLECDTLAGEVRARFLDDALSGARLRSIRAGAVLAPILVSDSVYGSIEVFSFAGEGRLEVGGNLMASVTAQEAITTIDVGGDLAMVFACVPTEVVCTQGAIGAVRVEGQVYSTLWCDLQARIWGRAGIGELRVGGDLFADLAYGDDPAAPMGMIEIGGDWLGGTINASTLQGLEVAGAMHGVLKVADLPATAVVRAGGERTGPLLIMRRGGLHGQVVTNANGGGVESEGALLMARAGSGWDRWDGVAYPVTSAELGGGAVGDAPFRLHFEDSAPSGCEGCDPPTVSEGVMTGGGMVLAFYGPVKAGTSGQVFHLYPADSEGVRLAGAPDFGNVLRARFEGRRVRVTVAEGRALGTGRWVLSATEGGILCDGMRTTQAVAVAGFAYNFVVGGCGTADFDRDGDTGTDADIEAFFGCLAGRCCPTCGTADFDGDGDVGTDADIEAFFRVLAGNPC